MFYTVYQINPTQEQMDDFNKNGYVAFESRSNESLETLMELTLRSIKAWQPEYIDFFEAVASVEAESLDEVFELTNVWDRPERVRVITGNGKMRSLSVGDIVYDGTDYMLVARFGFTPVETKSRHRA